MQGLSDQPTPQPLFRWGDAGTGVPAYVGNVHRNSSFGEVVPELEFRRYVEKKDYFQHTEWLYKKLSR